MNYLDNTIVFITRINCMYSVCALRQLPTIAYSASRSDIHKHTLTNKQTTHTHRTILILCTCIKYCRHSLVDQSTYIKVLCAMATWHLKHAGILCL